MFTKPVDNVGNKSIADYAAYAANHVYDVTIPGCQPGKVFVGQRKEPFAVNLGEVFDLVNTNAVGPAERRAQHHRRQERDVVDPRGADLVSHRRQRSRHRRLDDREPAAGEGAESGAAFDAARGRTNASVEGGALTQVSRLGNPLVNEVVIGLRDKDRFNASRPVHDPQFLTYVTNPALPELLEALFGGLGVRAPNNFPRNDLVAVFLTGIPGLTKPAMLSAPGEMLRLNTGIAATAAASQSNLGVIGGDAAGFPNGRRPGDDVVDIELRAAMGVLCTLNDPATFGCVPADAPTGNLPYTDGATVDAQRLRRGVSVLEDPARGLAEQLRRSAMKLRLATLVLAAVHCCGLRRRSGCDGSRRSGRSGRTAGRPVAAGSAGPAGPAGPPGMAAEMDLATLARSSMSEPEYAVPRDVNDLTVVSGENPSEFDDLFQ